MQKTTTATSAGIQISGRNTNAKPMSGNPIKTFHHLNLRCEESLKVLPFEFFLDIIRILFSFATLH